MNSEQADLRAALDETERVAREVPDGQDVFDGTGIIVAHYHGGVTRSVTLTSTVAAFLARHDPAAVLRMVAAHRRILAEYERAAHYYAENPKAPGNEAVVALGFAVSALAEAYGVTEDTPR